MSAGQPAATPYTVTVNRGRSDDEEEEPEEDGGDPYDILWIELFGGVSYVDLRAFSNSTYFPQIVQLNGTGGAGGGAVGFRVGFFSAGVRVAVAHYGVTDINTTIAPERTWDGSFDVGTAVGEVTLALPLPIVKPFLRVGVGLGWHGNANIEESGLAVPMNVQTTVFGWVISGAVGVDIYLVEWFAIGAAFNLDVLNMSRHAWSDPAGSPTDVTLAQDGDAIGFQGRGQGSISFHF